MFRRMLMFLFGAMLVACGGAPPPVNMAATTVVTETPAPTQTLPPTSSASPTPEIPARQSYRVINTYPHDPEAFTQGLIFDNGVLYEGTGIERQSTLRKVDLATGTVLQRHDLPPDVFGEGITLLNDKIIQLTWLSQVAYVYNKEDFTLLHEWAYSTEGWGLTHDGQRLIMSDGTATIYFRDPETFAEIGKIEVYDDQGPVHNLNELEYIEGEIYANIWQTDMIVRINPQTGAVQSWVDLSGLLAPEDRVQPVDVLNGIAYDPAGKRLFVTGKLWPKLFEIELIDQP